MNKKFLSAILFGALMLTSAGTFVSCKDYDDDIKDLQEQINKLATKDDMASQIATLQAALTSAASDASAALAKATAAETAAKAAGDDAAAAKAAAEKSAAEAKAAAIEAAQAEVAAAKAALEKVVADGLAENKAEMDKLRAEIKEATDMVEEIVGKIADMVTSVELITTTGNNNGFQTLNFRTIKEQENVFGKGLPGEMTFVKDAQVQVPASFTVRVSPTNAVLTPEMISLVNAQGQNLNEFLEVKSVSKKTNGYWNMVDVANPQSRAAAETGLWNVVVALKNYDKDTFNATTIDEINGVNRYKLFAVAVNNTSSTAATREVVSGYGLQLTKVDYIPQAELNYWVDYYKNVTVIRNRYSSSEPTAAGGSNVTTGKAEWKWISTPYVAANVDGNGVLITGTNANAVQATGTPNDNRSSLNYIYPAVQGKAFKVSLDYSGNTNINNFYAPTAAIKGMYVTLDTRNAVESDPSEINAWKNYSYTGLDQVVEGTSVDITINGTNIINDIIGLRVYAVNHDGTLVDPDGRAFYVRLGNAAADWNAANTVIVPDANDGTAPSAEASAKVAVSLTKLTGAATYNTWTTTKIGNNAKVFNAYFVDANDNAVFNTTTANLSGIDFSTVAKVYTVPATGFTWDQYEDDKVYEGVYEIKNANDFVLATIKVTMQKVLPTTMPAEFSVKTAQVKDGIYNCYMIPMNASNVETWTANGATKGSMDMTEVFNFGKGQEDQYEISFATSQKDANNNDVTLMVNGDDALVVTAGYINNTTKHATQIAYNYGKISSKDELNNKQADGSFLGYKVVADDKFETIYNCIYNTTYTWAWANMDQMVAAHAWVAKDEAIASTEFKYGEDYYFVKKSNKANYSFDQAIYGTSAWDGLYNAMLWRPYGYSAQTSLELQEVGGAGSGIWGHVITKEGEKVDEYFTVEKDANGALYFNAVKQSSTTNPTAKVPSTVQLTYKDMYGHDVVIELDVTILPR